MVSGSMMIRLNRLSKVSFNLRLFATSQSEVKHYKLVIAGGGSAGACLSHKFIKTLGKDNVAVVEPSDNHYYQALWTLVGGGVKTLDKSFIPMNKALPQGIIRYKDSVGQFDPDNNSLVMESGKKVTYDYLIVAIGIKLDFSKIPGVVEGLQKDSRVCSNYTFQTADKTFKAFKQFNGGKALFTFPNTPVKCAGAPQKIMYLFDDYLRKENKRNSADIHYFTTLPVIFTAKYYADSLWEICKSRDLSVHLRTNLIELDPLKSMATFEHLDTKEKSKYEYSFIHVTPPMFGYDVVKNSKLSDPNGFVSVDKETLQHTRFPNVFSLGDCSNLPTSKTAAAISTQQNVLFMNLSALMNKETPDKMRYNGYTSCPFVTRYNKGILAEFDYKTEPLETLPFSQKKESRIAFFVKAHFMPQLYWHGLIRGHWNGPSFIRKLLHFGKDR